MGCGDSMLAVPPRTTQMNQTQNYKNNTSSKFYQMENAKRPNFLNNQQITQFQKDTLWAIIQRNSVREFAYYLENQRIPSNVEAGPANTFWNFAHFCARWDAFECLHYMIKRIYAENANSLLSFMNQQTIEGYTVMHVIIEWNAINCFYLILDCGGVDLSYQDKASNDVFAKAFLFKRTEMLEVLQKFKTGNALMVIVSSQNARGFKDFSNLLATGQVQPKQEYRMTKQRIEYVIDTRNRLNRPPPPYVPPVQKNPNKFQDLNNKMKQIEAQKKPNTSGESNEEGGAQDANIQKILEQRKFREEQEKIKEQQRQNFKRSIEFEREQEERRLKAEMEQKINHERVYEQAELEKIEKEKQILRRNIEAMHSNQFDAQRSFTATKMVCPQEIRPFYQAALSKGAKFVDTQFPANENSLGKLEQYRQGWSDCVWLRPETIFQGRKFEVFDGISPDDVKQGSLSVCYYLSLLSSIAQNEKRIKKIFKFYDKDLGFYALQLYLEGKPVTIIVDDQIPCMRGINEPLFAKPNSDETWVMIFEKAWVKMFGSYLASQKMAPIHMLQNVLPAPATYCIIHTDKIDECYNRFVEYDQKNYIMIASSVGGSTPPPGIVESHAYSVIGVYNFNGLKICKVRNPWGKTQYEGMYSESSSLWTPELQKAVAFKKGDDGVFFLTDIELQTTMPAITASLYKDSHEYSWVEIFSRSNEDLYYVVNVKKPGEVAFKVTQQNERFKKEMEFQNAPIRFQIWKLGENYDAKILSEGDSDSMYGRATNAYSTPNCYENLEPGRYLIRLKMMYDRADLVSTRGTLRKFIRGTDGKNHFVVREGKCVLSAYGPESYVFNKLTPEEAIKYLKNGYRNAVLTSQKASQRSKTVDQDLKPTVIARDLMMRNQIIYYAQNKMDKYSINFSFKFDHKKFRNCSYAFNVNMETESCDWVIEPGGWNLATLEVDVQYQDLATEGELDIRSKIVR